jgi:hypothetical protein
VLDGAKPTAANLHFLQRNGTKTLLQDPLHFHKIDVSYQGEPPEKGGLLFQGAGTMRSGCRSLRSALRGRLSLARPES